MKISSKMQYIDHSKNVMQGKRNGLKSPVKSYIFLTFSYITTDQNFVFHIEAKNQKDVTLFSSRYFFIQIFQCRLWRLEKMDRYWGLHVCSDENVTFFRSLMPYQRKNTTEHILVAIGPLR